MTVSVKTPNGSQGQLQFDQFHQQVIGKSYFNHATYLSTCEYHAGAYVLQWVYNILEKKTEVERVIFEDPDMKTGFVLVPDMKWDGKQLEDLYVIALVHNRSLHSIRSLTAEHIQLLENIHNKGLVRISSYCDRRYSDSSYSDVTIPSCTIPTFQKSTDVG